MWIKKSKNPHLLSPDTHGHSTCGERLLVDAQWCRPRRAVTSSLLSSTELPCQRLLPSLTLAPLFFLLGSSQADLLHRRFRPTPTVVRRFLARAPPQPRPPPPPRSTEFSRASAESAPSTVGHHWSSTEASDHPSSPSFRSSSA